MSGLVTSSALQSRKWQLIGMSQWCRSALCGHPLPALTDNWTHGAASRHTIAQISHTRPGHSRLATCSRLLAVDRVWVEPATSWLRVNTLPTGPLHPLDTCRIRVFLDNRLHWLITIRATTNRIERWAAFSGVCLWVVCLSVNAIVLEPFEISSGNFYGSDRWSEARTSSKMAAFRCTAAHEWWVNLSDVLVDWY